MLRFLVGLAICAFQQTGVRLRSSGSRKVPPQDRLELLCSIVGVVGRR